MYQNWNQNNETKWNCGIYSYKEEKEKERERKKAMAHINKYIMNMV